MSKYQHNFTVPGLVLEQALDDYRARFNMHDRGLVEHVGLDKHAVVVNEDYDFDISDPIQRDFLWLVHNEAMYRIEAIEDMMSIDGGEEYHPRELRVFRFTARRLENVLSRCEQGV